MEATSSSFFLCFWCSLRLFKVVFQIDADCNAIHSFSDIIVLLRFWNTTLEIRFYTKIGLIYLWMKTHPIYYSMLVKFEFSCNCLQGNFIISAIKSSSRLLYVPKRRYTSSHLCVSLVWVCFLLNFMSQKESLQTISFPHKWISFSWTLKDFVSLYFFSKVYRVYSLRSCTEGACVSVLSWLELRDLDLYESYVYAWDYNTFISFQCINVAQRLLSIAYLSMYQSLKAIHRITVSICWILSSRHWFLTILML